MHNENKQNKIIAYSEWVIKHPWLVIAMVLIGSLFISTGMPKIGFDTNYRVFFGEDNPQLQTFETFQKIFVKSDNVIVVVKPKAGRVFEPEILELVQNLTDEAWKMPFTTRVDSITNYQHTYAEEDSLIVEDLVENEPSSYSSQALLDKQKIAVEEPLLVNRLISPNADTTGVALTIQLPEKDQSEVPHLVGHVRAMVERFQAVHPNVEFGISGTVMLNNAFSESAQADLKTLVPLMYITLIIAMLLFLKSVNSTIATVIIIGLSTCIAMGLTGFLGINLTPPSATAPTIILTLAIADSVHILVGIFKGMRQGLKKHAAIVESLRINFAPILLTSITTAIGFLSLNFSDAPPFRDLGNITAMGVIAAFVLSVTILPALLSLMPLKIRPKKESEADSVANIAAFSVRHRVTILISMPILFIVLGYYAFQIELNDQFVKYFDPSVDFRQDTDFMDKHLTGIYNIELPVTAKGPNAISEPEYLQTLEQFKVWAYTIPEVLHVYSMSDIFKRLNKNMHGDQQSYYTLPDDRTLAAQYLLLYQLSLPFGLDLNDRINVDESSTRVTVTLSDIDTKRIRQIEQSIRQWFEEKAPDYMQTAGTSPAVMFAHISQRNIDSMINGYGTAFLLICIFIGLSLLSLQLGIISIVPNVLPAIMAFGVWYFLVGEVDMAVATVAAVSLGIIVDDTVHILSKFQRGRKEHGLSAENAVIYSFATCGSALILTTVILVAGFTVLVLSTFKVNSNMGLLTALAIAIALIIDFLLLPALLSYTDKHKRTPLEVHP